MVVVEKAIPVNRIMLVNINKVKRKKNIPGARDMHLEPRPSTSSALSFSYVVVVSGSGVWQGVVVVGCSCGGGCWS